MIAGVDTGGTYTDVVTADGSAVKVLSDADDPARSVARGLDRVQRGARPALLSHGTTVATNALLEGRGAVVALVTTRGFRDAIEIGRQDRPSLYDPFADRPMPLVPRALRFEVDERLDAQGRELVPVDLSTLPEVLPAGVEAVAVCLLHADLEPGHELTVARHLAERGYDVTCSHEVSPEFREHERTVTTVANAVLRPRCREYLQSVGRHADEVLVMTSAGGLVPADDAAELPVALLLSGPAAGAQAAASLAASLGFPGAVSFDMGGTSTDVCLLADGRPEAAGSFEIGGHPIRFPALDIHTIGAGGGSVAWIDPGGALAVGPRSAGASPGPACYGRGGEEPTVTDADLLLGRIPAESPLPELARLDTRAARDAMERAGVDPEGAVSVVDANMVQAVRRVSVERGVDPRELALVAFGGAGPLHACAVADALGMPAVVVPPRAGVFSAVGLLTSPRVREGVRSWPGLGDHAGLDAAAQELADRVRASADPEASVATSLDCRYRGQSHELTVPSVAEFHEEHERRNGFRRADTAVEVVAVRARATSAPPLAPDTLPAPDRPAAIAGPAVAAEEDCTIWVAEGWHARRHDDTGALLLTRTS